MTDLRTGALFTRGLLSEPDLVAAQALIERVAKSDLETIRVLFPDQHGVLRGKTLVASALPSVFRSGIAVPGTLLLKDTSHRTAFPVWSGGQSGHGGVLEQLHGASDVLLVPDPGTFRILPWAPHSAWLLCDAVYRDGTPIPFAPRTVLRRAQDQLAQAGMFARMGLEIEFHVFRVTDPQLAHGQTTMPGAPPQTQALTQGYQFLTEDRYAAAEPVLDMIRRNAQGLGLPLRSIEIEMGPIQFEVTFDPDTPMAHADAMVMFRSMVKAVCAAQGLHATFMAKPCLPNVAASGWHLHQSVLDAAGRNLFVPEGEGLSRTAQGWIAGLLEHAAESCLLTAPTVNSYKRYGAYQLAPNRIAWGRDNRGAMVRALMTAGDPASRVENRVAEPGANPYYAFAAQLLCGLAGVQSGAVPPAPTDTPYDSDAPELPANLGAAIAAFDGSDLYRSALGEAFVAYMAQLKTFEWNRYLADLSAWEQSEYFTLL